MSLVLHLRSVENIKNRGDRVAKATFRGVAQFSKICESCDNFVFFDEIFRWNLPHAIETSEQIEIQIFNHNKYLANRLIGSFGMVLQQLIEVGRLSVSDCLLDDNNVVTQASINFDLTYNTPDPRLTQLITSLDVPSKMSDTKPLLSPSSSSSSRGMKGTLAGAMGIAPDAPLVRHQVMTSASGNHHQGVMCERANQEAKIKSIRTIGKMMNFVKKTKKMAATHALQGQGRVNAEAERANCNEGLETAVNGDENQSEAVWKESFKKTSIHLDTTTVDSHGLNKAEDYQVSVTIIEARQLSGVNMNPVVCVQVGEHKKYTSVKESTNCPYYNEYFVFDFNIIPSVLFDKIITISVLHSRNILRAGTKVGSMKIDVGTVYNAPDHHFYHKWAVLTDPDDIAGGPKGYVKCDIAVFGKGDNIRVPQKKSDADDDDIESNLLIPAGSPSERQRAKFIVTLYRAEALPRMSSGIVANVKKALTGEAKDLVDPYCLVMFAGHQGRTSVKKGKYNPVWNEEIIFTEMFPPFCRRFKVQVRDDSVNDDVIATHFIDLSTISNDGENGFLPTFGPSWVNLYGSTRSYSIMEEHPHLNEGIAPGIHYRGRILMSLRTDIVELMSDSNSSYQPVEMAVSLPVSEGALGAREEFHLFGSIFEVCMIDRRFGDKPVQFEMSIGIHGNVLDGKYDQTESKKSPSKLSESNQPEGEAPKPTGIKGHESDEPHADGNEDDEKKPLIPIEANAGSKRTAITPIGQPSISSPVMPQTTDKYYYFLPYDSSKPLLWTSGSFEDHRTRCYNSNLLFKMSEQLERGLEEVHDLLKLDKGNHDKKLKLTLENLSNACSRYLTLTSTNAMAKGAKTKLDKERLKHCRAEVNAIGSLIRVVRQNLTSANVKDKIKIVHDLLLRLKRIRSDPQHGLPDVFIWMIQNRKRVAYQRIPSRDLLFSTIDEEKGKYCGKMQTLMLRMPSKKGSGGWNLQARLKMYLWLGSSKQKKHSLIGLPQGYQSTPSLKNISKANVVPPPYVNYTVSHAYQLRAHIYQARGLIGSDNSGLSDPFARVVVGKQSHVTRVIEQTLNPSWDEMMIFREVVIYSGLDSVKEYPPEVVIEIFDRDRMGKSEFIGRAVGYPVVKASKDKYEPPIFPPKLEWHGVWRGDVKAGELLAAFELLQLASLGESSCNDLPPCELPEISDQSRSSMPVPKGIRPILSTYRIEILFWGVRDLKRIQFLPVEKPRIDVECSGRVISSSVIKNCKKNPNFLIPVKYMDVELPDNDIYCPPITIRCVDCRNFGRFVLAGNHVIDNIRRFLFVPTPAISKHESSKKLIETFEFSQQSVLPLPLKSNTLMSRTTNDQVVIVLEDEKMPLITKHESIVTIETGKPAATNADVKKQNQSKDQSKRRRSSVIEDEEVTIEGLDWWTKYHASLLSQENEPIGEQTNRKYSKSLQSGLQNQDNLPNGKPGAPTGTPGQTNGVLNVQMTGESAAAKDAAAAVIGAATSASCKYDVESKGKLTSLKFSRAATSLVAKLSPKSQRRTDKKNVNWAKLKIYSGELETEFDQFKEWLHTFDLYRGKRTYEISDDDSRVVGKFKGAIVIYKLPLASDIGEGLLDIGGNLKIYRSLGSAEGKNDETSSPSHGGGASEEGPPINSLFQGLPSNEPLHILVRVYVVKAIDLHPADLNGKADPYIVIKLGQTTINDKENYISKQLNPVFGKCFEVEATFPQDSLLRVQVYDWDLIGTDDIIGETVIDLENRYFSRHRATCGLALQYDTEGYNAWRDPMKPTQILTKLCKDYHLDGPFYQPGRVRIGSRVFNINVEAENGKSSDEHLALTVLHHWEDMPKVGCKLVNEHVETRPLFHPEKPGMEQGKLEMWIDMFPIDMPAPGPPVDISPRKPKSYELRVIIWNTDDVVLEDDAFFTGEKMSDIYVKGWLKGQEDNQSTDIHYRSLTGEGNFNWRFIFPFEYLVAEEKVVISRKDNVFSWDETETKIPARLNLQVWDADHFSADDFLGALTFDLTQFPRGAKSSKQCTLDMLKTDGSVPQMNLFKHKRVKGWWPFYVKVSGEEMELTGKVEAELHLLTAEEAEKHPTGQGRNEPDPLEKPNRPDTSFVWFLNPIKSLRYILWHNYRWLFLKVLLFILLGLLLALFFYSLPGYTVKKMLGA